MCIKFYELTKSEKGILIRALKMWYMFAGYSNMEKNENQLSPLVKPQRPSELHKKQRFSCAVETLLALQVGVPVQFFFPQEDKLKQRQEFFSILFRAIVYDCRHGPTTCTVLCY